MESSNQITSGQTHPLRRRWPVTNALLLANVSVFVLDMLVRKFFPHFPVEQYFGLSLVGLKEGFLWQLLTFQFLHGGIPHLLLNCWGIYVFGHAIEESLGRKRMLEVYLLSGAMGGGAHVLGSLLFPAHFGVVTQYGMTNYIPVVGASAGLFGLIAAFSTLAPDEDLKVLLLFVYPITASARVVAGICAAMSVLGLLMTRSNVAHGAHLGGMLAGFLYVRQMLATDQPPGKKPVENQSSHH